jgi:hypothetical protein
MPEYNFDLNPAIASMAKKLAKPLVQLGAENHEVALQAILLTLSENKCSPPDLAGIIERVALFAELLANARPAGDLTKEEGEQIFREAYAQGSQDAQGEQASKPPSWREIVNACWAGINQLNDKDRSFIASIRKRIVFDQDEPTDKQQKWLKDCYRKVQMNGFQHV